MPDITPIPYAPRIPQRTLRAYPTAFGIASCATAIFAIAFPLPAIRELLNYPIGTEMRPMWAVAMIGSGAATGLFIALPLAILCLVYSRRRPLVVLVGIVACLLTLAALLADNFYFNHIVASRGYVMEP